MRKFSGALFAVAILVAVLGIAAARQSAARDELAAHYETATLTGGCFWSLQETLRDIPGVIKTTAGYTGGMTANPTYELVTGGKSGHAEAVEVVFDPARLSYEQLLTDFLTMRNPTYKPASAWSTSRSGIFYHSEEQRQTAERVKEKVNQSGKWKSPVVTEITAASKFYAAEKYHQDYHRKTSDAQSCSLF